MSTINYLRYVFNNHLKKLMFLTTLFKNLYSSFITFSPLIAKHVRVMLPTNIQHNNIKISATFAQDIEATITTNPNRNYNNNKTTSS